MPNAAEMIRQDHERVRGLFKEFRSAGAADEKKRIAGEILASLEAHAKVEEDILYPAVRERTGEELLVDMAREEHHGAKMFVMELARMEPGDPRYDAKVFVLQEQVEHHMEEEESEMLPKAEQLGPQWLEEVGNRMEESWPKYRDEAESMVGGGLMANAKGLFEQAKESMGRD